MMGRLACVLTILLGGINISGFAQLQSCPDNINFSSGHLGNWSASTGLLRGASQSYPLPNTGVTSLPEYSINTTGIQVITNSYTDRFGGFPTIPTINGYAYNYAVLLGSTSTSYDLPASAGRTPGGFSRAISYRIQVPAGPAAVPYTMTYAYALVLENGTHNSDQQPLFKATLTTRDSVIRCASPEYYLPTFNDAGSGSGASTGATLDTASALANGFTNSPELFLSHAGVNNQNGVWLQDVWTKNWTEVTFDLSPYRGQEVTLTFEADNCNPGGHFAYAYVALRNTCAGLEISGNTTVCSSTDQTYSIPALAGAIYTWTVPAGWSILSGSNTNIIEVRAGTNAGYITVQQVNSCANLKDTLLVATTPPTEAGQVNSNSLVCAGNNSTQLTLSNTRGTINDWIYSTNGSNWTKLGITGNNYTAQNLITTTRYAALVQNGPTCRQDTSMQAIITVDPKSQGGVLSPSAAHLCLGETVSPQLQLQRETGTVSNWQWSDDSINWNNVQPAVLQNSYQPAPVTATTFYRTVVQSGVCPPDTSAAAVIRYFDIPAPQGRISPDTSSVCFGETASLTATITIGTSYTWSNSSIMQQTGTGRVPAVPYTFFPTATPATSRPLVMRVYNEGCPTILSDTFYIRVAPRITVFAGRDTAVVAGQALQLQATSNLEQANRFTWSPATYLNNAGIPDPVASYPASGPEKIVYTVKAATDDGCSASDDIAITIFKTGADIFMPTAFTPNGDGKNDVIMPVCVGIQRLHYFRVYNRWGQLVFYTSEMGKGWDGRMSNSDQGSNSFVYMVEGMDINGRIISKKGSLVLIR